MRSEELTNGVCSHHVSHILGNHVRHEHPVVLCLLSVHRLPLIFPRLWFKFEFFSSAPRGTISGTGEILQERYSGNPMEYGSPPVKTVSDLRSYLLQS